MKRFLLTPLAEQDLLEIWEYIGDDSVESANRVLGKIEAAIYRLTEHPGLGRTSPRGFGRQTASVLSGLFLLDRLSPWNGPVADDPGLTGVLRDVQTILGLTAEVAEPAQSSHSKG